MLELGGCRSSGASQTDSDERRGRRGNEKRAIAPRRRGARRFVAKQKQEQINHQATTQSGRPRRCTRAVSPGAFAAPLLSALWLAALPQSDLGLVVASRLAPRVVSAARTGDHFCPPDSTPMRPDGRGREDKTRQTNTQAAGAAGSGCFQSHLPDTC